MDDSRLPAIVWRGETISLFVLGTAQLGLPGYGVANRTSEMNQEQVDAVVKTAWESDVRLFDTAQAYGNSEERLGQAFRNLGLNGGEKKPGARIVTKLAPDLDCKDARTVAASLEQSLARLGQERLWGVMLHRFAWLAEWDRGLGEALNMFREQGGVKYLGVSVYEAEEALAAIEHPDMDIIQIPANAWDGRMMRAGVFERARERDKLLFVRSIFLQGLLLLSPKDAEAKVQGAGLSAKAWAELCRQHGCSSLELSVNWAAGLHCPLVIGAEATEQIAQIARIFSQLDENSCDVSAMWEFEQETILTPTLWGKMTR